MSQKYVEQSFQISLLKIRDGFEKAFMSFNLKKPTILFVDGIDARPRDIDNEQYFECLVGLVNAVLEMNQSFLKEKQIKIMLLIRPDIMYKMPVHNMNQKLRNNSVLLNWVTSYRKYLLVCIRNTSRIQQTDYLVLSIFPDIPPCMENNNSSILPVHMNNPAAS